MKKILSRRQLLKALAVVVSGIGLGRALELPPWRSLAQEFDEFTYLPLIHKSPTAEATTTATATTTVTPSPTATSTPEPPPQGRVVHVHSTEATFWSGQTDYWNYVNQAVVNEMADQGMMTLTRTTTVANAWQTLLPNYQPGQGIAIKVNFNNSTACNDTDGQIDALIQPVNAVVRGLKQIGVVESDIWIYDAIRVIPDRFVADCLYHGVRYFDRMCNERANFDNNAPNAYVTFDIPVDIPSPPVTKITDALINATYLINLPIMKNHGYTGVTLGFKNHFGTIDNPDPLHNYVGLHWPYYRSDYSLLVDIYQNPHIADKTILTIGDGLFASKNGTTTPPSGWTTFGNHVPNSLFFAIDPVAIDCVMCDFLAAEISLPATTGDYLQLAGIANLGVFERGAPWGNGYNHIDYHSINL